MYVIKGVMRPENDRVFCMMCEEVDTTAVYYSKNRVIKVKIPK